MRNNAKQADSQDMIVRVVQDGVRGQGSVKARNYLGWSIESDPRKRPNDGAPRLL